jgi:hypothetical protein
MSCLHEDIRWLVHVKIVSKLLQDIKAPSSFAFEALQSRT